jgi:beta-lactamase regulating signal transducer with metallopeptidase domain
MSLTGNDWLLVAWTQVWQVTVLIVTVAIMVRLVATNRPQLAFALWLIVFLKCVTPPLWSSPTGAFCWMQLSQTTIAQDSPTALAVTVLPADATTTTSHDDSGILPTDGDGPTWYWCFRLLSPVVLLTTIWATGGVAVFAVIAVRRRRIAKLIRRADTGANTPYAAMFADLTCRLRIHRRIRLLVTEGSVGPAVLGFIRPTVLLPRAVMEGKSADEIEMVLAHELMHVRRGDLWFALLRTLVQSLWWFHPLVWWAGRRASHEAERCCDEAVLAELRCNPARYARCLLDILEIKQRLLPVPAFPGIHAIEVNQGRLEQIMKIGRSGYRRTPWWCWALALLAAVTVLPGAAMVISADEGTEVSRRGALPGSVPYSHDANATPANPGLGAGVSALGNKTPPDTVYYTKTYSVKDVLSKIREEQGLSSEPAAKECLAGLVRLLMASAAGDRHKCQQPEKVVWLKDGDDLVVGATNAGHKRAADALDLIRKYGTLDQVAIEIRFVTLTAEELQNVLPDSTMSPLTVDGDTLANSDDVRPAVFDRPLGNHEGTCVARAQQLVEKDAPVRFRIMDKDQGEKLIQRCRQKDTGPNVPQAPKITVFNGQTACVSDTSKRPFVVGVIPVGSEAKQPQVRVFSEGTMLQLRPIADQSGTIHLDFAFTFSKVEDVDTVCFNRTPTSGTTIQIPKMATVRVEGGAKLMSGQWLLLGGSKADDQVAKGKVTPVSWKDWLLSGGKPVKQRETQELVLMLRAEKE